MKKYCSILFIIFITNINAIAQCAMCTKTAAGLNDTHAQNLNNGIVYLAFIPLILMGVIGFVWWRHSKGRSII
jgi:amino acid transporter